MRKDTYKLDNTDFMNQVTMVQNAMADRKIEPEYTVPEYEIQADSADRKFSAYQEQEPQAPSSYEAETSFFQTKKEEIPQTETYSFSAQESTTFSELEEEDDFLLSKIDEFREKAKNLQQILNRKETKVKELQVILNEREDKAEQLQQILEERQKEAEEVSPIVTEQVQFLMGKVNAKLENIENSIRNAPQQEPVQIEVPQNSVSQEQMQKLYDALVEVTKQLEDMDTNFDDLADDIDDISEKIHSENVKSYRNTVDLFRDMEDKFENMDEMKGKMNQMQKLVFAAIGVSGFHLFVSIVFFFTGLI